MSEFFPYRFDRRFVPMWLGAGALPRRDGVTLTDDDRFVATFGVLRVTHHWTTSRKPTSPVRIAGGPRSVPDSRSPTTG